MEFLIKTPNKHYEGVTEGVQFSKGIGRTSDQNLRNVLVNDYKYEDVSEANAEKPQKSARKTSAK